MHRRKPLGAAWRVSTHSPSPSPAEDERIQSAGNLDKALAGFGMQRLERMADGVGPDHPSILHERLGGGKPALAILVVNEGQPTFIGRRGL